MHLLNRADYKTHAVLQSEPETGHTRIGDRNPAPLALLHEDGNNAAAAADNIAIAGATEASILRPGIGVRLNEHFFGAQLGGSVEIDGVYRLVGAESEDAVNAAVDRRIDHVAAAHDVGLNRFEGIVFAGRNLLERGRVHDDCDPGKSAQQAGWIAHIPDKIAQAGVVEAGGTHVMLLQFVAAENYQPLGMIFPQHDFDELLPERTRPAGDQYFLFGPIHQSYLGHVFLTSRAGIVECKVV